MARYDRGMGSPRGYDGFDHRVAPRRSAGGGYDGMLRERGWAEHGYPEAGEEQAAAVYGPARYGLGPYHERLHRRRRPDEELRSEVEEALFYDSWVDAEAIQVEVSDGVVTLRGELPDFDEIRYATDDAWDVDGVRGVRSELRIRGGGRAPGD